MCRWLLTESAFRKSTAHSTKCNCMQCLIQSKHFVSVFFFFDGKSLQSNRKNHSLFLKLSVNAGLHTQVVTLRFFDLCNKRTLQGGRGRAMEIKCRFGNMLKGDFKCITTVNCWEQQVWNFRRASTEKKIIKISKGLSVCLLKLISLTIN